MKLQVFCRVILAVAAFHLLYTNLIPERNNAPVLKFSSEKERERNAIIEQARAREREWREKERIQSETIYHPNPKLRHEPDDVFIKPDFTRVLPEFKSEKMIVVDFPFHFFKDQYGLIDPGMNESETIEALREVSNIWIRGNIYVRFRVNDAKTPTSLLPEKGDVYKWWITGAKKPSLKNGRLYAEKLKQYQEG